jgi:hypothetical protein
LPAKAARPELTHALIVGIEPYVGFPNSDLDGPLNDALAIRAWLLSSGVPPEQIHLHVSALKVNQLKLDDPLLSYQEAREDLIRKTINSLQALPLSQSDLIIVYWAGHGLISNNPQCHYLLHSSAALNDMVSYSVENLRGSFASTNCNGFPQQIFLFDTCRQQHRQYKSMPPIQNLAVGEAIFKEQFLFFACQEGQAAINLSQEKCGLFTKVLLEELHSSKGATGSWPPEIERIASAVQEAFNQNPLQYPVYKYFRDKQGNEQIDPLPDPTALNPGASAEFMDLSAAVEQLAELLAEHLGRPRQRSDVLRYLRIHGSSGNEVFKNSNVGNGPLDDYREILMNSLEFAGSLNSLRKVCLQLLGARAATPIVDQAFSALLQALDPEGKTNG